MKIENIIMEKLRKQLSREILASLWEIYLSLQNLSKYFSEDKNAMSIDSNLPKNLICPSSEKEISCKNVFIQFGDLALWYGRKCGQKQQQNSIKFGSLQFRKPSKIHLKEYSRPQNPKRLHLAKSTSRKLSFLENPDKISDISFPKRLDFHCNNSMHDTFRQRHDIFLDLRGLYQNRTNGPRSSRRQGKEDKITEKIIGRTSLRIS